MVDNRLIQCLSQGCLHLKQGTEQSFSQKSESPVLRALRVSDPQRPPGKQEGRCFGQRQSQSPLRAWRMRLLRPTWTCPLPTHLPCQRSSKQTVIKGRWCLLGCVHTGVGALTCMCKCLYVCSGKGTSTGYCPSACFQEIKNDSCLVYTAN